MDKLYLTTREAGSVIIILMCGLAIIGCGVLAVLRPEMAWKLEHLFTRWMYRDAEPSDNALVLLRVVGAAAIVGGIFFILVMLRLTQGKDGLL